MKLKLLKAEQRIEELKQELDDSKKKESTDIAIEEYKKQLRD